MALFGHSGSQAPQFMHSSLILYAITFSFCNYFNELHYLFVG